MNENNANVPELAAAYMQSAPAAGVQVLPRTGNEIPYPNCLVVEPYRETTSGERLLASVEHFTEIENTNGFPWKIVAVNNETLEFQDAMELALAYAKRRQVPVILVNHDSLSSDSERRMTDTTVIKIKAPKLEI
jgi:hypothetical protein